MIPLTHDRLHKFFDTFSSNEVTATPSAPPYSRFNPQETAPEQLKWIFKFWKTSNVGSGGTIDFRKVSQFQPLIPEAILQNAFGYFMRGGPDALENALREVYEASDSTSSAPESSIISQFGTGSAFESTTIPGRESHVPFPSVMDYQRHPQRPFLSRSSARCF
jgi:hypothetical protein